MDKVILDILEIDKNAKELVKDIKNKTPEDVFNQRINILKSSRDVRFKEEIEILDLIGLRDFCFVNTKFWKTCLVYLVM